MLWKIYVSEPNGEELRAPLAKQAKGYHIPSGISSRPLSVAIIAVVWQETTIEDCDFKDRRLSVVGRGAAGNPENGHLVSSREL